MMKMTPETLQQEWDTNPRWKGINRPYRPEDVLSLRTSLKIEYSLAKNGAERLWDMLTSEDYVHALGAMSGNQAVQMVQAGLKAIYLSGWQTAADANLAGQMYPDQSLYPANSVPRLGQAINNALMRADQVQQLNGGDKNWYVPLVADAEAGFGGNLNAFELTKAMIEAGIAGIHYEDQLSSAKKCGHMGGKVLVPTQEAINRLVSARLAADVMDVPTVIIARTDAEAATLITSDVDETDRRFILDEPRTSEGFYPVSNGLESAIARGLSYAPYVDMVWCETKRPDIEEARAFAEAIHAKYPGKMLMYNCSPSFNWSRNLDAETIAIFQRELGAMGYKFQFITLAGFHALNLSMYELATGYRDKGMSAYSTLQDREFELEREADYTAVKHQAFVGTAYFDTVQNVVTGGAASTTALTGSTEEAQFTSEPELAAGD